MKHVDLTKGKVGTSLLKLAIPIIGTSVLQLSYSLIDMLLVGGLGSEAVASVGLSTMLIWLINALQVIVVIGTGTVFSHALGASDTAKQHRTLNAGYRLNLCFSLILAGSILLIRRSFIAFMDVGNATVETLAAQYLLFYAPALFFSFINLWHVRVYNSSGLNKKAFRMSATGFIISIILAPILIYVVGLGVAGAGLTALVANLIVSCLFFIDSRSMFTIDWKLPIKWRYYSEILRLGVPIAVQRILFNAINIMMGSLVASFGVEAVAGQQIGLQIESITFFIIGGLNGAIASFVGQNYGASEFERIKEGVSTTLKMGIAYALFTTMLFLVVPEWLARVFVRDPQTIAVAASYLRINGVMQVFMATEIILNGAFTGLGLPKIPAIISVSFNAFRLPLAWLFIIWFGVSGIWLSIGISMFFKGTTAFIVYSRKKKELRA